MKNSRLRIHALGLLVGYGLQFIAGMVLNLFVTLAKKHPGSSGKEYFSRSSHSLVWALSGSGSWELAFHVYLALGLIIGSVALFIRSLSYKSSRWIWVSGLTALFTIGAFFNGLSFVDYSHNVSSMIMASCWLLAVGSLTYGLIRFHKI